jgi:2-polyprenyl-3-methyl-5-hydroxy-6-metoxy-1,4-benzoquinol methylase
MKRVEIAWASYHCSKKKHRQVTVGNRESMMEDIACIFCERTSDQVLIEENGYKGRKCSSCGVIFVSPRPTLSETLNIYSHNQAQTSAEVHIARESIARLYARHNLGVIKRHVREGALLEIGAGAGYFLDEGRRAKFDVYGIEPNQAQADFIKNTLRVPCEETALNESSFNGKKFDIIYHCDVLSHFHDPIAEFKKINSKLNDGGLLVFETGNIGDIEEKYLSAFTAFNYPDHLFFYGENSLKELLKMTGFEPVKIYTYSILVQLLVTKIKAFKRVKEGIRGLRKPNTVKNSLPGAGETTSGPTPRSVLARPRMVAFAFVASIAGYFLYLIRYKLGRVMPKRGMPQTVIVIARKSQVPSKSDSRSR